MGDAETGGQRTVNGEPMKCAKCHRIRIAGSPYCREHGRRPAYRGYGGRWRRYRAEYLREHPWCDCGDPATEVDHIWPARWGGDFWDPANHKARCKRCHSRKTAEENR